LATQLLGFGVWVVVVVVRVVLEVVVVVVVIFGKVLVEVVILLEVSDFFIPHHSLFSIPQEPFSSTDTTCGLEEVQHG